jgi:hypothetical protein
LPEWRAHVSFDVLDWLATAVTILSPNDKREVVALYALVPGRIGAALLARPMSPQSAERVWSGAVGSVDCRVLHSARTPRLALAITRWIDRRARAPALGPISRVSHFSPYSSCFCSTYWERDWERSQEQTAPTPRGTGRHAAGHHTAAGGADKYFNISITEPTPRHTRTKVQSTKRPARREDTLAPPRSREHCRRYDFEEKVVTEVKILVRSQPSDNVFGTLLREGSPLLCLVTEVDRDKDPRDESDDTHD